MSASALKPTKADSTHSKSNLKPANVFYVWYSELCRRSKLKPLSIIKPARPKNETVLDFVGDKIKPEEWAPIIKALRLDTSLHVISIRSRVKCPFLDDVDTEEKLKQMKRRAGSLHTTFILKSLFNSLGNLIGRSNVLSALELDGLPIGLEYLEVLVETLKCNKTIKLLSLKHCNLKDVGCQMLCNALKGMPNIQVLNLTASGLNAISGEYIAKLVKFQQINRYCESWHNSLRYEDPETNAIAGLKRITLNSNPYFGNEGLIYILDELDDDLWIKALDMQRCGITEEIAPRLIDIVTHSKSLEVADFRNNEHLERFTVEKILDILKNKQDFDYQPEFQWCVSTTTLSSVTSSTITSVSSTKAPIKSKSGPCKAKTPFIPVLNTNSNPTMRRIKTCTNIPAIPKNSDRSISVVKTHNMLETKNDVLTLNRELQREMQKRKEGEVEIQKLKEELEKIKSVSNLSEASPVVKEKVVKFDMLPPSQSRLVRAKTVNQNMKSRVEFVFENSTSHAPKILQNMAKQNKQEDSDNENDIDYYKDIVEDSNDGLVQAKQDNDSTESLIKLKNEMKSEDGNKDTRWLSEKLANCFQKMSFK